MTSLSQSLPAFSHINAITQSIFQFAPRARKTGFKPGTVTFQPYVRFQLTISVLPTEM
jgi:hypothetical protein